MAKKQAWNDPKQKENDGKSKSEILKPDVSPWHEERFRAFFNSIKDAVFVHPYREEGFAPFIEVNDTACERYGYTQEEFKNLTANDITVPPDVKQHGKTDSRKKLLDNRRVVFETTHIKKSGEKFPVEINSNIIEQNGEILILAVVRDITERKRAEEEKNKLEERLKHAEKLEAIGTLAGGVAHEFNNILAIIMGNIQLAMDEITDTNPARDFLKEINRVSLRAKDIVKNILNFARKSLTESAPIKIGEVIRESIKLIRSTTPAMIEIRQQIECKDEEILGDATEVSQVLINLCNNAIQAISEETGVLEVTLKPVILDQRAAAGYEDLKPGRFVRLTVKDSGCGIDPKIIGRIFDPYFSTGSLAERTGMGLSITHGIVKKYGGSITVESMVGLGTAVEILFPVMEEKGEHRELSVDTKDSGDGRKRILFVDDEDALIIIWRKILQNWGYEVETSTDSLSALELFRADPDRFDLVISDIGMPRMPGDKLAQEIMKTRNNIPIIICTGYSDRVNEEKAMAMGISRYITKPISIDELEKSIKEVLV